MNRKLIKKHFFEYLVMIIAILIIILDTFNITEANILLRVIVAVLAILIFILIKLDDRIDMLAQIDNFEGISGFRLNRENIPSLESTFKAASQEIIFWGSALYSVHDRSDLMKSKLNQGCKVKILMMSLFDENGNLNPCIEYYQKLTRHVGFKERVSVAKKEFENFAMKLDNYEKELFEIRYYTTFPTVNYVIIDRDYKNGLIRVEPCILGCQSIESPSFDIDMRSGLKLFKVICRAFDEVWENSIKFEVNKYNQSTAVP